MISRNNIKPIILALIFAALALFATGCNRSKAAQNRNAQGAATASPTVVQVSTAPAVMRQLPRFFEATGSLAADEQTDVAPAVGGKVVAVGVDLGSFVQRGAVIVRLDDRDARIRLEQAEAQLTQQQAAVRQAEEKIGLRPGQAFDAMNVPEAKSARVALDLASKQLARFNRLIAYGDVSRASYDQQ